MHTATSHTEGSPVRPGPVHSRPKLVLFVGTLIVTVLTYQLNASLLSAALPAIATSLGEDTGAASQIQSLFFLAGAVLGMVFSRWSDFLGRRKTLLIVMGLLILGTFLCLVSPNLPILLIGRVIQGASNATFTIAFILLSEQLTSRLFGVCAGVVTAVNGGVGGIDGFLGGFISDTLGWRSLFVIVLGIGVLAVPLILAAVPKDTGTPRTGQMDWWGAGLLALLLVLLTNSISAASTHGFMQAQTMAYLAGTAAAGITFILVERRVHQPLIAVSALRSRQVWPIMLITVLTLSGVFSALNFTIVILSQDASNGYGMSASMSALLYLTPTAFVGIIAAVAAGWVAQRLGWVRSLRISSVALVILAISLALFVQDRWIVFAVLIVMGVFYLGQFLSVINGLAVLNSPTDAPGSLPGLNGACFGIGASTGIAVVAPLVSNGGYSAALWVSAAFTLAAAIAAFILRPSENAEAATAGGRA